ncbi:carboxylesterase/lipase family protein [Novosphingobium sp.]|uniref:carboxylesterase/lipase family protein n=1 Tax=Novosphingobium sp. TaxID=1874826 RepID=UPI00352A55F2
MARREDTSEGLDRRGLIKGAAAAGLALGSAPAAASAAGRGERATNGVVPDDGITTDPALVTARTVNGRIRGYRQGGVLMFKGVPYAASTAGAKRFQPPQPVKPWQGVRSTLHYGPIAPQDKGTGRFNDEEAFIFRWNDAVEDEDCLRLNLWTAGCDDVRRPVLVWLHGGGFAAGSGHDIPAFDGENLARTGEAVVVTLNHRLNVLGFLDLSSWNEDLRDSANAGMLDIVAALRWVKDNIAEFGGDPARVTVFGQSGGGAKVSALMGMPAARGLFHRAAIFSGSFAQFNTPERSARLSALLLQELGVRKGDLAGLQAMPYATLRAAAERVTARINPPFDGFLDVRRLPQMLNFAPVVDGRTILPDAVDPAMPRTMPEVPLIIGSTLNEFVTGINNPDVNAMDAEGLRARVEKFAPGRAGPVIEAFRRTAPDAAPFALWSRIATAPIRQAVIDQARRRVAAGAGATHLFWFTWQTPILDGRPMAFHCLDIPFWFGNAGKCASMTGGGRGALDLAGRMSGALLAFAATGSPDTPALPQWRAVSAGSFPSLRLDGSPRMDAESDAAERASLR